MKLRIHMCRRDLDHAFQHFQATLGLFGLAGFITETGRRSSGYVDFFLLPCIHRLLQGKLFRAHCFKLAVIAGIGLEVFVLDMRDVRTQFVEEVPVMRYQK